MRAVPSGRRLAAVAWLTLAIFGGEGGVQAAELGQPAPDFTLPDLAGKRVRLGEFRGKKGVLINFWATWCPPCRKEMPTLERLARERRDTLQILAVSLDTGGKARVLAFASELGLTFPILLDPAHVAGTLYRVTALPVSFLVDRDGLLRHREIGYRDWTTGESRFIVEEALRPR